MIDEYNHELRINVNEPEKSLKKNNMILRCNYIPDIVAENNMLTIRLRLGTHDEIL